MISLSFKKWNEKILIIAFFLIHVVMFAISIYGWTIGDVLGGVMLSCLPASLLASFVAFYTTFIEGSMGHFLKKIWIVVALISLLTALMFSNKSSPDAGQGAGILLTYVLLILAFPISLLLPFVLMTTPLSSLGDGTFLGLVGIWIFFFIPGYVQWFILLPWLWRKWKSR
jgi:hypothetical protein